MKINVDDLKQALSSLGKDAPRLSDEQVKKIAEALNREKPVDQTGSPCFTVDGSGCDL